MSATPLVGLALGGGAAKGFAHLGVLKVLVEEQVPIDLIAGASIGSFFGAVYGAGTDLAMLEGLLEQLPRKPLFDFTMPNLGLIRGDKIEALLRLLTKGKEFSELNLPVYVVAVDIEKGEKVIINEGLVAEAIRGSIAIPGIFTPKRWQGRLLVDGSVLERVPVRVAREYGADLIIAVDVKFGGDQTRKNKINNIFDVILNSIELMEKEVAMPFLTEADILIQPNLAHVSSSDYSRIEECISIGEAAAREAIPRIQTFLANHGINYNDTLP